MRPPVSSDTVHEDIVKREPEFEYSVSQVVADVASVTSLLHARHLKIVFCQTWMPTSYVRDAKEEIRM